MKKTIFISGAAGYGLNTLQYFFENALKGYGYYMHAYKHYMSRIRGGFNYTVVTFSDQPVNTVEHFADVLICLDENGFSLQNLLNEGGITISYRDFAVDSKLIPMATLGALLKAFGFEPSIIETVKMAKWSQEVNEANQQAVAVGYEANETRFALQNLNHNLNGSEKPRMMRVNGNQAVALGAMAADLRFFSAYPMAPSTGIMMTLSKFERKHIMAVEQVEDEIAGIIAALGASSNGARAMTATSGGGFSLMVEGLGFAGVAELPIVIANVQRPGPATGLPTRTEQADLEFISRASQGEFPRLIIAPTSIESAFYDTQVAFNLADKYQMPVIILTDQYLADSTATVPYFDQHRIAITRHINTDPEGYKRYDYSNILNGRKFPGLDNTLIMNDSHVHDEYGHMTEDMDKTIMLKHRLMKKLDLIKAEGDLQEPQYIGSPSAKLVFMAWGSTAGALKDAVEILNQEGHSVGALIFTHVFPVPDTKLKEVVKTGAEIINVEQNYNNQFGKLVRAETGISFTRSINKYDGRPITSHEIVLEFNKLFPNQ